MKAVILAAGMGTRLGTLIPKPLTSLKDDKTIMDFQVEKISKKIGKDNIIVVVGYKKEILMEKHPELMYVYNSAYTQTNTAKSLLLALRKIDDDVIWLNGDVYFDDGMLDLLTSAKNSSCLVNTDKCAEEEIKYTLNGNGYIHYLSKQVKDAEGEAIGVNLIKKEDLPHFRDQLGKVADDDYFEKALENLTLEEKINLEAIQIADCFCKEIDFPEDLDEVRKYIIEKE